MAGERKQTRNSLSLSVKLQILKEIEVEKKKKTDVAQKHNIPQSSLSTIIKNSEKIHQQALHAGESSRKRARGSTYADVDEALLQWFKRARSAALPVNGPLLSEKAKTLALEFGLKDFLLGVRWKARHGIKLRNICGESADVNRETMTNWLTDVMPNIISNYACKDIFNADETGLFWRLLPDKTLHFKGETCTGGKASKERITILLCCNMDGSEKMQPLVIGKAKQPRCFRGIKHLPFKLCDCFFNVRMSPSLFIGICQTWTTSKRHQMTTGGERTAFGRLTHFLYLGTEGNLYVTNRRPQSAATDNPFNRDNVQCIEDLIADNQGLKVVEEIQKVHVNRLSYCPDAPLFALALCAKSAHAPTRIAAYQAFFAMCSTSFDLFTFIRFMEKVSAPKTGWGRALRRAVSGWYNNMEPAKLAEEVTRYISCKGWTHKDVLRLGHVKPLRPGYIVRLETGRISLIFTTIKLILKYFIRLQKMEDNRLPKLCWNRLKEISLMTKKPIGFCKNIMDIINHCGLTWLNYRLNYDDIQIELPNILKIKIEQLLQQDLAKLSLTKTYSNYRLLYDSFIPENYFSCNLSSALVSFIAQIRLMSTMIKENHIYAIKKEDLYCGLCGSQITDGIYHFIAECGDLEGERKKILKSLPRPHLNSIKLIKTVSDKKSWAIELFNFQKAEIKDLESRNKSIVESKNIHRLKLFQQEVNERKISLNQIVNTLLESELDETQYEDYSKAKDDIFNMLVSIEEALSLIETKENTHSDKQLPESNVNLPKINLPIFNGDSANWLSFREIFNSTINSNQTLTEIQKFQYLNASVKGPAEKLIRGFPISDRNYQQAWDTLCNRFNNRRELAFSQINKIFSIRPLKSISTGSLYEILDVCNEGIRNLSVLGLEKNTLTDLILINFFEKRIGEALRKEWELTLQNEEYPTFENFVNFLEKHARSLQGMRIPLFQEQNL
ncbi:TIGD4 [Cordylochernes scorpioides]|uniref:TIGD4 n=1 Tax=Cordylochernes scorpioides TaxID=51811 RepID=A0ABY6KR49_9ARAC|nr:TIGD4 [Cordylochernes scorpioides]